MKTNSLPFVKRVCFIIDVIANLYHVCNQLSYGKVSHNGRSEGLLYLYLRDLLESVSFVKFIHSVLIKGSMKKITKIEIILGFNYYKISVRGIHHGKR